MTADDLNTATAEQLEYYMHCIDRQLEVETNQKDYRAYTDLWWKCKYKAEAMRGQSNPEIT